MMARSKPAEPVTFRYAVLDLAVLEELHGQIGICLPEAAVSLFSPSFAPEVLYAGPWLVHLGKAPGIAQALSSLEAERPWGYYLSSGVDIVSMRQTLRRMNLAELPDPARQVLFRYWDPRVMRMFLKVAMPHQLEALFDFIDHIEFPDGSFHRLPKA